MRGQQREGLEEQKTFFSLIRFGNLAYLGGTSRRVYLGGTGGQHVCCHAAPVVCSYFTSFAPFLRLSIDSIDRK